MAQQLSKHQIATRARRASGPDADVSQHILDAGFFPPGLVSVLQELPRDITKWQTRFTLSGHQVTLKCHVPRGVGGIPHGADHELLNLLVRASQVEVGQRTGHRVVRATADALLHELRSQTLRPLDLAWLRCSLDRLVRTTYHWHQRHLQREGTPGSTGLNLHFYLLSQFSAANTRSLEGDLASESVLEIVLMPELISLYTGGLPALVQPDRVNEQM